MELYSYGTATEEAGTYYTVQLADDTTIRVVIHTVEMSPGEGYVEGEVDTNPRRTPTSQEVMVDLAALFQPMATYDLYQKGEGLHPIAQKDQYGVRDGSTRKFEQGLTEVDKVLTLAFAESVGQVVCMVWGVTSEQTTVHTITPDSPVSIGALAANHYQVWVGQAEARYLRRRLLQDFDAHSVLAYLEAQVDLLSLVVQTMLTCQPELKQQVASTLPVDTILQAIADTSVLTVKGVESCLQELETTKSAFRKSQHLYLEAKRKTVQEEQP